MNRPAVAVLDWAIPIVLLAAATLVFWFTDVDLAVERYFYDPGGGWIYKDDQPWHGLYKLGVIPAWCLSISALAVLIASLWVGRWARHRRAALFLVLVMALGPGLLVNQVFKQHWGRPRPLDVYELGGDRPFVPVWEKSPSANGNSFASGHASTGYYLFAPWFIVRRRSMKRALGWLALGVVFGSAVGLARMVQGAHFPSDVVWAAGMVYLTGLVCCYALGLNR